MKIYTLGTSHGNGTFSRFNSSTLYETDDGALYLIDAGAPVESLIRRKGLEIKYLRAVFITHMHDDHAGGLTGLIKQIIKYPEGRTGPVSIFLPQQGAAEALTAWLHVMHIKDVERYVRFFVTCGGGIYQDDKVTVSAVTTAHLKLENEPVSFGYTLCAHADGKRVLHTGDLRGDFADFPKIAQEEHFDVCLCEATHHRPQDALPYLAGANIDRLIFIHIADRWHVTQTGEGWTFCNGEKALLSHYRTLPYPIQIAHDGDEFLV